MIIDILFTLTQLATACLMVLLSFLIFNSANVWLSYPVSLMCFFMGVSSFFVVYVMLVYMYFRYIDKKLVDYGGKDI